MKLIKVCIVLLIITCCFVEYGENKSLVGRPNTGIRSDVIVTSGFKAEKQNDEILESEQAEPGWTRRQLMRFGEMTSTVGNKLGGFAAHLSSALDKICQVVKTIIPVIAAVCHVGQFEFCGPINEAPQELADALSPNNLDLSVLD